jgi:hypothetical protein
MDDELERAIRGYGASEAESGESGVAASLPRRYLNCVAPSRNGDRLALTASSWRPGEIVPNQLHILNVATGELVSSRDSGVCTHGLTWTPAGRLAYVDAGLASRGEHERFVVLDPSDWSVVFSHEIGFHVLGSCWLSEEQLALISCNSAESNQPDEHCGNDVLLLNFDSGQLTALTDLHDMSTTIACVKSEEIWCVRQRSDCCPDHSLYNVTSKDTVLELWQRWYFDTVYDIDANGRVLLLRTPKYPHSIIWQAIKSAQHRRLLLRALKGRTALATGVLVVDGFSGRVLWSRMPGIFLDAMFSRDGRVACIVLLEWDRWGLIEYDLSSGSERLLAENDQRIDIVGEGRSGWIVQTLHDDLYVAENGALRLLWRLES